MIEKCGEQLISMRAGLSFRGSWRGRGLCEPHESVQGPCRVLHLDAPKACTRAAGDLLAGEQLC